MSVSNTVCSVAGCGESREHPLHHGRYRDHSYRAGASPSHAFIANCGRLDGCWWCGQPESAHSPVGAS
jgi:hypothetical protein